MVRFAIALQNGKRPGGVPGLLKGYFTKRPYLLMKLPMDIFLSNSMRKS